MTVENPPTTVDALPPGVRDSFEWADGPEVIAFLADLRAVWAPETVRHAHVRGQLMYVEHGVLTVHTEQGTLSPEQGTLSCRRAAPAGCRPATQHTVELAGPLRGWGVVVAAGAWWSGRTPAPRCPRKRG
ncbi:hypothetical protein XPR_2741 [Xanthomonas arboricola pv. pruni MAFF 301420]|uniref:Uncharacterized protein n=1 Tax=Xanthomonas arboricola pv. pruni MAFF 301420 TaxID=1418095 RepID=W4SHV8_9XANT|nr:hypothetical protein XPR_2741 [Xanthomonas arboricola pv. pruni MAFF 301420]